MCFEEKVDLCSNGIKCTQYLKFENKVFGFHVYWMWIHPILKSLELTVLFCDHEISIFSIHKT